MSEPATPARPFYVTGGTLKPGEPSYVERRADRDLFDSILAGEFCYVLTARQMGKSSLMARTATRLEQAGVASAIVDLTQIGSERGAQAAAQWYFGIANEIHRRLRIDVPLRPWWQERSDLPPAQRLTGFFRELVLAHCPGRVVIFVDEIDSTVGLPFADDFFAALRACFNARATEPEFERLTFVLLGVATPDQLIQDPTRTPFNIGKRIDLTDFTPDEARTLAPGLHADPGEADQRLERILYWTGGHPYLSQALCRAVRERASDAGTAEEAVDPRVNELFLTSRGQREESNLKHARARLERPGREGRRLLQLYRLVRQGKKVPDQSTSPLFAQLKLTGVVKATDEGRLAVRNRIYEAVFTPAWARSAMPPDRGRQFMAVTLTALLMGILIWAKLQPPPPDEVSFRAAIEDDAYNSARVAYTALYANPSTRYRATELMQQFWEHRALLYALSGDRDKSLLSYLKGLGLKDSERVRRKARNLVGQDYERLRLVLRHGGLVSAVAFSPDGEAFVTGSWDNTAQLWDAHSGRRLSPAFQHQETVTAVAFSPDMRTVLTGSWDGTARLWDARSGKLLSPTFKHQKSVAAVAFSPDGDAVLTGSRDGTARLWDAHSGKPLTPPLQHQDNVLAVAFSPDGRAVLTGSADRTARLWDAHSGKPLSTFQHHDFVRAVAFSPDGRTVLTGSRDGTARLWDVRSGRLLSPTFQNQKSVAAVAFSLDGQTVLTGSSDRTARLWDARSGKPLSPTFQNQSSVVAAAFSPDGRSVLTGSVDKTARLWDARSREPLSPTFQQQTSVATAAFSPDGEIVLTGSTDKTARLWEARSGKPLIPPLQHQGSVEAVAFSHDGWAVLTGSADNTARLWDARSGKPLIPLLQHQAPVLAVAFSPNGGTVLTGSGNGTAQLWDAATGKALAAFLGHTDGVIAVAFSPDGRFLATGSYDKTARLWDTATGKPLATLAGHELAVASVAFSRDGSTLATGSVDAAQLWDTYSGKLLARLPFDTNNNKISPDLMIQDTWNVAVAFNPNGNTFFVATDNWLNSYSWDGKKAVPLSSQLFHGFWMGGFRFPSDCKRCLQVALGDTGNSFHLETLHLDEPTDPPIEGDPKKLLEKWEGRLGMKFDEQMRPVPAVDLPGGAAGVDGDGRRSPGARPR